MTGRRLASIAAILFSCLGLADVARPASAPEATAPAPFGRVVKLLSTSFDFGGRGPGGPGLGGNDNASPAWVVVAPAEGGKAVRLNVLEAARKRIEAMGNSRGQLVWLTVTPGKVNGVDASSVTSMSRYEGDKAILNPKAWQFDGLGQTTTAGHPAVTLQVSRGGPSKEFPVANRPAAPGVDAQPDSQLLARLKSFTAGDIIEYELAPGKSPAVVDAFKVTEPVVGEFVKLSSLKDAAGKPSPAIVIDVAGAQKTYSFAAIAPAGGTAAPTPTAQAIAGTAAMQTVGKRLKPGFGVSFVLRDPVAAAPESPGADAPAEPRPPQTAPTSDPAKLAGSLRELKVDGRVEATGEKSFEIISTYLRITLSESRGFGGQRDQRPGAAAASVGGIDVEYRPGDQHEDSRGLIKGIERVIESENEANKLKITLDQTQRLDAAMAPTRNRRAAGAEQAQWLTAYKAWMSTRDDEARRTVEQEMLWAAQELSLRARKDQQAVEAAARTILKSEQFSELEKLGKEDRGRRPGLGGPGGMDRDRNKPGQDNPRR